VHLCVGTYDCIWWSLLLPSWQGHCSVVLSNFTVRCRLGEPQQTCAAPIYLQTRQPRKPSWQPSKPLQLRLRCSPAPLSPRHTAFVRAGCEVLVPVYNNVK
jgi:hypothetical protein